MRVDIAAHIVREHRVRHAPHRGSGRHLRISPHFDAEITHRAVEHPGPERRVLPERYGKISLLKRNGARLLPELGRPALVRVNRKDDIELLGHRRALCVIEPPLVRDRPRHRGPSAGRHKNKSRAERRHAGREPALNLHLHLSSHPLDDLAPDVVA
jgi:hypothetical protein